jgi:hypothetical protein
MRRRLLACVASAVLLPAAVAGSAAADGQSVQAIGQEAASQQSASSSATSTQEHPSNANIAVRIGSPGNGGAVTQANTSSAASAAGNVNTTAQQAAQQVAAGAGVQLADQSAANEQSAASSANSTQSHPQNENISVRIMSPGDDGSVTQTNSSDATSAAANKNATGQSAAQSGGGSGGTQHAGQQASNKQDASSEATSEQKHPSNVNVPVRIFSPGDGGSVKQTNSSSASSAAGNKNATSQKSAQDTGSTFSLDNTCGGGCGDHGASSVQDAEQKASNEQSADSSASATQEHASNVNAPVRIYSEGDDGTVTQTNSSTAESAAGNLNVTGQSSEQSTGSDGVTVQAVGQKADNDQDASSEATSEQVAPSNVNSPVRIKSAGDDGDVQQSNASSAHSAAGNANWTSQDADQDAGSYGGTVVQAVGQWAASDQSARSSADASQKDACNTNAPVRVKSPGDAGDVQQSNSSSAESAAGNLNVTEQATEQAADAWSDVVVQAVGQKADNDHEASSSASSEQIAPSNDNGPIRVLSWGGGGSVEQSNASYGASAAGNRQWTRQGAGQVH